MEKHGRCIRSVKYIQMRIKGYDKDVQSYKMLLKDNIRRLYKSLLSGDLGPICGKSRNFSGAFRVT